MSQTNNPQVPPVQQTTVQIPESPKPLSFGNVLGAVLLGLLIYFLVWVAIMVTVIIIYGPTIISILKNELTSSASS